MEINFDPKKLLMVSIDQVRPNKWNPKKKETSEFNKVVESIKLKGLRQPIIVRENEGFEIIDGEQRWTACKKLGYENIFIYNEGKINDKTAKELTIWYQVQVPFDSLDLAKVIKEMTLEFEDLELPYSEVEMEEMVKMSEFNFDEFEENEDIQKKEKEIECPNCQHLFKI